MANLAAVSRHVSNGKAYAAAEIFMFFLVHAPCISPCLNIYNLYPRSMFLSQIACYLRELVHVILTFGE